MTIFNRSLKTDPLVLVLSSLLIATALVAYRFTYWRRKKVFAFPSSIPFGNASNLILQKKFVGCEFKELYEKLKQKGLRYGGYYFFTKPIFVPIDLDLIKRIMNQDFAHFTDHVHYINEQTEPLTADLSSLKGAKWKRLRTKLTPTFTSGKMRMMFQTLLDCTQELSNLVEEAVKMNNALDIKEAISRFSADVIGSCAFGLDLNSLKDPDSEFRKYGQKFFYTSTWHSIIKLMLFLYPEMLSYVHVRTLEKDIHDFFMNFVTKTVRYREQNNIIRKDFLHILIQLKNNIMINESEENDLRNLGVDSSQNKGDTSITLQEMAAQCFFFFVAGFETSSTVATFLLYELAQNSDIQETLRDEISNKFREKLTYDAISAMPYMDKCINETLRKYPPISIHTRECTQTYQVPNSPVVLEKGSAVFIPVLGIQRDPEYYSNPEKFDPERFSEENKAARHPSTWTPFGDGPRTCIAMRFGIMQTKVAVITLLKDYKLKLNPKTSSPLTMDPKMPFVLSAKGGIWLDVEKAD